MVTGNNCSQMQAFGAPACRRFEPVDQAISSFVGFLFPLRSPDVVQQSCHLQDGALVNKTLNWMTRIGMSRTGMVRVPMVSRPKDAV